jgi:3-oxosteroid 1-dehydrogenase
MSDDEWNYEVDIVVVGSGAAAHSAALIADENGADVIMVEKADEIGGTTARSGGGFWVPNNRFQRENGIKDTREDAVPYMARYSFPHIYNREDPHLGLPEHEYNLISTYYDTVSKMMEFLENTGKLKLMMEINWTGKPQVDYMENYPENKDVRGRVIYTIDPEGNMGYGVELMRQLTEWRKRLNIPMLLNHRIIEIISNDQGEVIGVKALNGEKEFVKFRARKAVIFGSGGFTHNPELMLRFQRGPTIGGCAAPTNTGDFVLMGQAIGAQLGNMANAFKAELVLEQALNDPEGIHNVWWIIGDSALEVNKYGRRVMDEKRDYNDRTMQHFVWDPAQGEWTNQFLFMIYDQRTADLWQGFPPIPTPEEQADHIIKGETLDELSKNINSKLIKLSNKIGSFKLHEDFTKNLKETLERFNGFAKTGVDEDFHRGDYKYDKEWATFPPTKPDVKWPPKDSKNYTMYPLAGPYYAIILGAGTLDTNGGPLINHKAQVLNTKNEPITGLYGAGNCIASACAGAYWGGGATIGNALTFGYIAGLNAIQEEKKNFEK